MYFSSMYGALLIGTPRISAKGLTYLRVRDLLFDVLDIPG